MGKDAVFPLHSRALMEEAHDHDGNTLSLFVDWLYKMRGVKVLLLFKQPHE